MYKRIFRKTILQQPRPIQSLLKPLLFAPLLPPGQGCGALTFEECWWEHKRRTVEWQVNLGIASPRILVWASTTCTAWPHISFVRWGELWGPAVKSARSVKKNGKGSWADCWRSSGQLAQGLGSFYQVGIPGGSVQVETSCRPNDTQPLASWQSHSFGPKSTNKRDAERHPPFWNWWAMTSMRLPVAAHDDVWTAAKKESSVAPSLSPTALPLLGQEVQPCNEETDAISGIIAQSLYLVRHHRFWVEIDVKKRRDRSRSIGATLVLCVVFCFHFRSFHAFDFFHPVRPVRLSSHLTTKRNP